MQIRHEIPEAMIVSRLEEEYGFRVAAMTFLPLGADPYSTVYCVRTDEDISYFLKVRSGNFDAVGIQLPRFLCDQGITQIIAPILTQAGQLDAALGEVRLILFPFVTGRNGVEEELSAAQWMEFGIALKQIHSTALPSQLSAQIQTENYSSCWREKVRRFLMDAEAGSKGDLISAELSTLLKSKHDEINLMVERAEKLGAVLQNDPPPHVLCHADIHAYNILTTAEDRVYLVDWDNPRRAPVERDLMFIGAGIGGVWNSSQEAAWFYQGYGHAAVNPAALAYYRYERIVEDIAVDCEEIFLTAESEENRSEGMQQLAGQFLPGSVAEIAHRYYQFHCATE